ncbi:hypothetical protein CO057_03890 [Candidatus Uhrbacteria bacterium CG_4_9_14_0_2_um_filter_41_50]|uniref:Uncharacterized protein n=1 Tax=Candidatus Uhrbacteria bacterium CG_4_9_14_0_2_um_filter_41_50 TaxID=1975031 RepID=A0A2M8ENB4_9BACT|nr:MAG: hypothetical protein COZ45_01930 [Candidatus Uhrbacteria bacterium CG_4_10_14_3_um_filter_41_21]PIZ55368.1 MAG: hypothetical protein COY24_00575 [Candidatus Uhrbacteria bacterium CG_4_10_14_0_2_um_filter_41_21]PJB84290.1 MAG: hypothetical protein CO086_04340 [Candidatus Uhrbacteria bacterium CG_4_9_14_0_8_um_filter_41_16]PJC24236.1 MAG: hypothetical protein CO057_03890 [Candidatus Uhrbacteria bacterium CG_4_9_14_0_2_um_filter_41_50]PJE74862.1 MAG: hypothetical protein COV03_03210 [Candi
MTITTHAAIGAVIGFSVGNPVAGFIIGMCSHFLVDMIPHGDSNLAKKFRIQKKKRGAVTFTTIDAVIAIYVILGVSNLPIPTSDVALSAAIAGSIMPDLVIGLHDLTKSKYLKWFVKLHFFFHDFFSKKYGDIKLGYAIIGQAVIVVLLLNLI